MFSWMRQVMEQRAARAAQAEMVRQLELAQLERQLLELKPGQVALVPNQYLQQEEQLLERARAQRITSPKSTASSRRMARSISMRQHANSLKVTLTLKSASAPAIYRRRLRKNTR